MIKDAIYQNELDFLIEKGGVGFIEYKLKSERKAIEKDIADINKEAILFSDVKFLKQELKTISLSDLDPMSGFDDFDLPF